MRAATVFNFLIESTLMGSIMILLMLLVRRFLRRELGSRFIRMAWALVALRLLLPLSLPNPSINQYRPTWSTNVDVRPIADQVRVRTIDAMSDIGQSLYYSGRSTLGSAFADMAAETSYGHTARWVLLAYLIAVLLVLAYMVWQNVRFQLRLKKDRVGPLDGAALEQYQLLCKARKVKPLPVYWVDPLPSACLVGVFRPYIAMPLTISPQDAPQVLLHELCHQKGLDHWWGLVRNLCCVVHWFNPLVWLSAHCFRLDQELACDDRVTAPMDDESRIAYANTLALAAARRSAPDMGVLATGMTMKGRHIKQRIQGIVDGRAIVKWLAIAAMVVACVGTLISFATSEALTPLSMPNVEPLHASAVEPHTINSDEEAALYARQVLQNLYGYQDASAPASVTFTNWNRYNVEFPDGEEDYRLQFDQNGTLWTLQAGEMDYGGTPANPTYITDAEKSEPFFEYIRTYAQCIAPDVSFDRLFLEGDYWEGENRFLTFTQRVDYTRLVWNFTLQIEPEVCVRYYSYWDENVVNSIQEQEQIQRQQSRLALEQVSQSADAAFVPMTDIVPGSDFYQQAQYASSMLTEVYSYEYEEAETFVYAQVVENGQRYCVYHDPRHPSWKYVFQFDDHSTARTPFTSQQGSREGEGAFRTFWSEISKDGSLVDWEQGGREAFVQTADWHMSNMYLPDEAEQKILSGEWNAAQAVQFVFENWYGAPEQWSQALTEWRDELLQYNSLSVLDRTI